jgi:hypothetical protein
LESQEFYGINRIVFYESYREIVILKKPKNNSLNSLIILSKALSSFYFLYEASQFLITVLFFHFIICNEIDIVSRKEFGTITTSVIYVLSIL